MNKLNYSGRKIRHKSYFLFKKILGIICIFIWLFLISCSHTNHEVFVNRIIDGDTFIDQHNKRYRFFGIDAPEMSNKVQGTISKNYLFNLIHQKNVEVVYITKDQYKRAIVKVYYQNLDIGLEMVKNGYAFVAYISSKIYNPFYSSDFCYYKSLLTMQYYAYKNKLGFWNS